MANKYTLEEIVSYIESNSSSKLLDTEYINASTKMTFLCSCGNIFTTDFNHFKSGRRVCTSCAKKAQYDVKRLSIEDVSKRLQEKGLTYVSGKYKNQRSKIAVRCSCGNIFSGSFDNLISGSGLCKKCSKELVSSKEAKSLEDIQSYAAKCGAELLSKKYKNAHSELLFRCSCGNKFRTTWNRFLSLGKTRCRSCSKRESSGERIIREWLDRNSIDYVAQKIFSDCGDKRPFPFDFYLPKYNTCIEYDGEFHYIDKFGDLDSTKIRDSIKTKFCLDNGINLIRIPYYEKPNIEDNLSKLIPR